MKHVRLKLKPGLTHNLAPMARAAGVYLACWAPHEMMNPDLAAVLHDSETVKGDHHVDTVTLRAELRSTPVRARDLIDPLRAGIAKLKADPDHFKTFEAANGWGTYPDFVPWIERYLESCEGRLDAHVRVHV